MLVSLLIASAITAAPAVEDGTLLTYRGTLVAEKGDPQVSRKTFDLNLIVMRNLGGDGVKLYWTLSEKGRGGWPWSQHFGVWELDKNWRGSPPGSPSLLYDRPDGLTVVPIIVPILSTEKPLEKGAEWTQFRLDHRVMESEKIAGRDAWKVNASNLYGRKRTLWVDKKTSVVVGLDEVVFIGQGEQHELTLKLQKSQLLAPNALKNVLATFGGLRKLRQDLRIEPATAAVKWTPGQLSTIRKRLPELAKKAAETPIADLLQEIKGDSKDQKDRDGALAALERLIVGKPAPEFELRGLRRDVVSSKDLKDTVTVLHFWEYRDSPLREPYGQIGYLDFLNRRFKEKNVAIFGVMVDERIGNQATLGRARASARKLKAFMNLSYNVLLDEGSLLKQFGDPRVIGAKLPLYVVVDASGKVVHYHSGFYEVDRDHGLKELADVIMKSLETGE